MSSSGGGNCAENVPRTGFADEFGPFFLLEPPKIFPRNEFFRSNCLGGVSSPPISEFFSSCSAKILAASFFENLKLSFTVDNCFTFI